MEAVRRRWCRSQVVVVVRVVDGRRDSPLSRRREVHLVGLTLHCIRSHTIDFFYSPVLSITLSFPPLFLRLITSCLMGVRRGSEKPSQKFPSPPSSLSLPSVLPWDGKALYVCVLTAAALQSPCMLHHLPATTACPSGTWKPKLSPSVLGCGGDVYVCSSSPYPPLFLARLRVVGTDGGGAAAAGGGGERRGTSPFPR